MRDLLVKIALRLGIYQQLVEYINRLKFEVQARRMRRNGLQMLAAAQEALDNMKSHFDLFIFEDFIPQD